jgi:hypothetical protein
MVPVPTIACQPRSFETKDSPHFAAAYFRNQTLETRALNEA